MRRRRGRYSLAIGAPGAVAICFDDVFEFVLAARACGLPGEPFVDATKLKGDLKRFGVLRVCAAHALSAC